LDDLLELKAIAFEESEDKFHGRPAQIWKVSSEMNSLIKLAQLTDT